MNKQLKLSEALRKGAEGRTQIRTQIFGETTEQCCADGALYIGLFGEPELPMDCMSDGRFYSRLKEAHPELIATKVSVSARDWPVELIDAIWMWNDVDKLTFEEIAQKLEEIGY